MPSCCRAELPVSDPLSVPSIDAVDDRQGVSVRPILEAVLLCAPQPLTLAELHQMLENTLTSTELLQELALLAREWDGRALALVQVATGWRFQTRPMLQPFLERLYPEKPPRYSRATLETLAIIAWRQPCTRGDIEDIRGVAVNSLILKTLEDRNWIETIGHRETIGRPGLLATTRQFLDDLGLQSLQDLPSLETIVGQLGNALIPSLGAAEPSTPSALTQPQQAELTGLELSLPAHMPA